MTTAHGIDRSGAGAGTGAVPVVLLGDGSAALPSLAFVNSLDLGLYRISDDEIGFTVDAALQMTFGKGLFFIKETANAKQTFGITVNQDTVGDEIFALKANNVNHSITDETETNTWFTIKRNTNLTGGARLRAYSGHAWGVFLEGAVANGDTTKSSLGNAPVEIVGYVKSGTGLTSLGATDNLLLLRENLNARFIFDAGARLYMLGAASTDIIGNGKWGINEDTNANLTIGLTINQGANDDQILCFKSSDIATGLTTAPDKTVETDDWLTIQKTSGSPGGAEIIALGEDAVGLPTVLHIHAHGGQASTGDTTSSEGLINLRATEHDGANALVNAPANQNIFTVQAWRAGAKATCMLLKGDDGELHLGNTTLVALDDEDDMALIAGSEYFRTQGQAMSNYQAMRQATNYDDLVRIGLLGAVTEAEWNAGARPLVSMQRSVQLMNGAARQKHSKLEALLEVMEAKDPSFRAAFNTRIAAKGMSNLTRN